jgi:hypothetical protein
MPTRVRVLDSGTDALIFLDLFQNLTSSILSVVDDVPVDSETPVVEFFNLEDLLAQTLGGAHRGRIMCVCS